MQELVDVGSCNRRDNSVEVGDQGHHSLYPVSSQGCRRVILPLQHSPAECPNAAADG